MSRLDSNGVLHDYGIGAVMAFDEAPRVTRARRAARRERVFTVTTDTALRAAREQRAAADHARECSPMARAIKGYGRLT